VSPAGWASSRANEIPYKPEALARKQQNTQNWLTGDPEIKYYVPGVPRATYMPLPVSNRAGRGG
jgi:hypothetical protein